MSDYTAEHASALSDVREAGIAITFVGSVSVAGYAIRTGGKKRYRSGTLVEGEGPELFFVPITIGEVPDLNSVGTFGTTEYVAADVDPLAINGTAIAAHITVAR